MDTADQRQTVLQLDVAEPTYSALATSANRIAKLLNDQRVRADPDLAGSLDDFLGAVYALILARHGDFADRTVGPIEVEAVVRRAGDLGKGRVRLDGKWMAGFHFNSALFRCAAVYHRLLKIVVSKRTTHDWAPQLRTEAANLYQQWRGSAWSSGHIHAIHEQVNDLKHTPQGVHNRRTVMYTDAVAAVSELLDLVEAWTGSSP